MCGFYLFEQEVSGTASYLILITEWNSGRNFHLRVYSLQFTLDTDRANKDPIYRIRSIYIYLWDAFHLKNKIKENSNLWWFPSNVKYLFSIFVLSPSALRRLGPTSPDCRLPSSISQRRGAPPASFNICHKFGSVWWVLVWRTEDVSTNRETSDFSTALSELTENTIIINFLHWRETPPAVHYLHPSSNIYTRHSPDIIKINIGQDLLLIYAWPLAEK